MTNDPDLMLLRPEKAAELLSVGRTTVYALMRSGALRSVRIGTLRRIPPTALVEFVAHLEKEQAA
ncbi:helix-turn-helix domain-containing protein [Streptosporangium sp. NPDC049644]|uniref:helix-turn-helix domain-containing protein n=1 Tax=Streptosporangium sp. NPDC049644 TaxID=3155507 RepID=UPI0034377659